MPHPVPRPAPPPPLPPERISAFTLRTIALSPLLGRLPGDQKPKPPPPEKGWSLRAVLSGALVLVVGLIAMGLGGLGGEIGKETVRAVIEAVREPPQSVKETSLAEAHRRVANETRLPKKVVTCSP